MRRWEVPRGTTVAESDSGEWYARADADPRIDALESCARELLAYIEANGTDVTAHLLLGKYAKIV